MDLTGFGSVGPGRLGPTGMNLLGVRKAAGVSVVGVGVISIIFREIKYVFTDLNRRGKRCGLHVVRSRVNPKN